MLRTQLLRGASLAAVAVTAGLWAPAAFAATDAAATDNNVAEVVVTGSFIAGTPEDAALPVNVIGAEELAKQGSPTVVEMIKNLSVSNGVLGDSNQFDARAQGSEGTSTINLRGLGPSRTLVLLNGRRMATSPRVQGIDINILPIAAVGRIEVLKDGAAATYGSDAIAGVVNFITRKNVDGLEAGGSYSYIDGSDGGDYTLNAIWGWQNDVADILLSGGYQHRGELRTIDRDWAVRPYLENPQGGWSAAGSPGLAISPTTGQRLRDPNCNNLGGFAGFSGATPVCYWSFASFDNITEKEDKYQLYGQLNVNIDENNKFHLEGLYSHTDVPNFRTSPGYAFLVNPTGVTSPIAGQYYVPASNPGLANLIANAPVGGYPGNTSTGAATSVLGSAFAGGAILAAYRPFGLGGNPLFGYDSSYGYRNYTAYRISGGFNGQTPIEGVGYDVALTYSVEQSGQGGRDTVVNRFERALRGLGGANCDFATGVPGVGNCSYFNPFGTAFPRNAVTGAPNPGFVPGLENTNKALIDWFFPLIGNVVTQRLFVADFVLNGKLGVSLPGGDIGWAAGLQYRKSYFHSDIDALGNLAINPCVDSPDLNNNSCLSSGIPPNGPLAFLGGAREQNLSGDVWAGFGEVQIPVTDTFNLQASARYENFGGGVGSTFNPQVRAKWQIVPAFALRGSVGTTFRAPPDTQVIDTSVTSLQAIGGVFRAVRIFGNPNLAPEKATTFNIGGIFETGNFNATVDYWNFNFKNPIVGEPVAGMVAALFPAGAASHCGEAAYAALQARFTFTNLGCAVTNVTRLDTKIINGAKVKTSGLDFSVDYRFDEVFGGAVKVGGDATYIIEYKTGSLSVEGIAVQGAFDGVGLLNYQTTAYPLPQWKGSAFVEYTNGPHNVRATLRYVNGYTDQRLDIYPPNATANTNPGAGGAGTGTGAFDAANNITVAGGKHIDSLVTVDLAYRVFLPWDTTLTLSATNLFDADPPFARLDLNYDPFTASPLGRVLKVGVNKKF